MFIKSLRVRFPDTATLLYGSEAREEANVESDLDVLLVVQPEVRRAVSEEAARIVSHLTSAGAPYISVITVDQERWQLPTPFNSQVKRDAVAL